MYLNPGTDFFNCISPDVFHIKIKYIHSSNTSTTFTKYPPGYMFRPTWANKNIINTDLGKSGNGTTYHYNPKRIDEDSKPKK